LSKSKYVFLFVTKTCSLLRRCLIHDSNAHFLTPQGFVDLEKGGKTLFDITQFETDPPKATCQDRDHPAARCSHFQGEINSDYQVHFSYLEGV
jgi:hypothetical protein